MSNIISALVVLSISVAGIAGYVMNIVSIFSNFDVFSGGEAVVRIGGIIIPLVGAVVGWF